MIMTPKTDGIFKEKNNHISAKYVNSVSNISRPLFSILITGSIGSGKSTAAAYLQKHGWYVISAGDVIRDMCLYEGLPTTRKALQTFGENLINRKGAEYFANILLGKSLNFEKVVFEGIRPLAVVSLLKESLPNSLVIFLEVNEANRKKRLLMRKCIDPVDFDEIINHPLEQSVLENRSIADIVINNDGNLNGFYHELDKVISTFFKH